MKRLLAFCSVVVALLALAVPAVPRTLAGVSMPDRAEIAGKNVILNGMGIRKATFLNIKVYVAGLYLETRSSDASQILRSSQNKRIVMHFLRDVGREDVANAWKEGFHKNNRNTRPLEARIGRLIGFARDMKEHQTLTLTSANGVVEMKIGDSVVGTVEGADFAQALFAIWLGPEPPNDDLKEGLLGK